MKIVKEHIQFEQPSSKKKFRGRLFPKWYISIIDFSNDKIQVLKTFYNEEDAMNYTLSLEDKRKMSDDDDIMIQKSFLPKDEYIKWFNGLDWDVKKEDKKGPIQKKWK